MSIKRKIFFMSIVLIAVFLCVQAAVFFISERSITDDATSLVQQLKQFDESQAQNEIASLAGDIEVYLSNEENNIDDSMYHAALILQKLDTLTNVTLPDMEALLSELRINDLYLADMDGYFTVSTVPEAVGGIGLFDIWEGYRMLVTGEATELPSAIKVMVETGEIYKFTALPRYDKNGNIKGVLESALEVSALEKSMDDMISNNSMISSFHLFEPDGITLMSVEKPSARESFVKGTTYNLPDIETTLSNAAPLILSPGDGSILYYKTIDRFGGPAYVMRLELEESYYIEGTNFVGSSIASLQKSIISQMLMIVGLGIACMLLIVVCYMVMVNRAVLRPVSHLQTLVARVSQGDISPVDHSGGNDEIGQLENGFAGMVDSIYQQANVLNRLAGGDYTAEVSARSDKDMMNAAISHVIFNTNNTLNQIGSAADQISAESMQIADGAQALASGSTQQAAAIEELSASIGDITNKTVHTAEVAKEAATLSSEISINAEKSNAQMDQMMEAVKEINDASNQIGKVIKAIDDIAFQTNILALNAAVEAARAGQHGKGFAVVADEVRNLASKSAEAAKDTEILIENSIDKANLGFQIATETSESLKKIMEGINQSAAIVEQIALSSEEQSSAISQINTGIDQVSHVVHQNSATAEESAAASQEMSGQASILSQLTGQFKLK